MIRPFIQKIIDDVKNAEPVNRLPQSRGYSFGIYGWSDGTVVVSIDSSKTSIELTEFLEEEKEELKKVRKDYEKRLKESIENMTHPFFTENA